MNCPLLTDRTQLTVDYCADRLPAGRKREFEQHLQHCQECREACDKQQQVWAALELWTPEPISPGFRRELMAQIDAERAKPWWESWRGWIRPAAPLAAAGAVGAFALWVSLSPVAEEVGMQAQPPSIHHEQMDVDQVERTLDDLSTLQALQGMISSEGKTNRSF